MAELENRTHFAELLAPAVKSLKHHPDFKIKKDKERKIRTVLYRSNRTPNRRFL